MAQKERSPAQLANDERLRQRAAEKARQNAEQRAQGDAPAVFVPSGMVGPDDAADEVVQATSITTEGAVSAETVMVDAIHPEQMSHTLEDEKFMNEKVQILVEASEDPNAPLFIPAGHNGTTQWIQVGTPIHVRRKFLYSLMCAKSARLVSDFGKDSAGKEFNKLEGPKRTTHRVIVLDDTPKGRKKYVEWAQMP